MDRSAQGYVPYATAGKSETGFLSTATIYQCEDCTGCHLRSKCNKAKGDKRLEVCSDFVRLRELSLKNITSDKGILLRINRSIMSEGAFGIIKEDRNFRRFLLRGNPKIHVELMILAFAFDVPSSMQECFPAESVPSFSRRKSLRIPELNSNAKQRAQPSASHCLRSGFSFNFSTIFHNDWRYCHLICSDRFATAPCSWYFIVSKVTTMKCKNQYYEVCFLNNAPLVSKYKVQVRHLTRS